jgi:hypothetical protein
MIELNIPPDSPWVHNTFVGSVPPELNFLINRLATLNTSSAKSLVADVAKRILWIINLIRAQRQQRKGPAAPRGYIKELEALRSAAKLLDKKGGRELLDKTWATISPETRKLVWPFNEAKAAAKAGDVVPFRDTNLWLIAPPDPLPMIRAALKRAHRDKRVVDPLASKLTDAIRDGYIALTGKLPPGRIRRRDRSIELQALARDIDQHFSLNLYLADGTHLRALRRVPEPKVVGV